MYSNSVSVVNRNSENIFGTEKIIRLLKSEISIFRSFLIIKNYLKKCFSHDLDKQLI